MYRLARAAVLVLALAAFPLMASGGASASPHTLSSPPTVSATKWTAAVPPAPGAISSLSGVSCTTSTFCIGVGAESGSSAAFIEQWNGTAWSQVTHTPTSTTPNLAGVSCIGTTFCIAVGSDTTTHAVLIDQWNGSTWSAGTPATPPSSTDTSLAGVSCLSATSCTAVGQFTSGGVVQTLAEQWNGTSWTIQTTPTPSGATASQFGGPAGTTTGGSSVSCTSATFCAAVGQVTTGGVVQPLAEQWNGTAWAVATTPTPTSSTATQLLGVSCIGSSFCEAVGNSLLSGTDQTLVESFNGNAWTVATTPNTSSTQSNQLFGVDCFSMTTCSAVGTAATTSNTSAALALVWDGSAWSVAASTPSSADFDASGTNGVSCLTNWECVAVGLYSNAGTNNPFVMTSSIVRSGYRFVASDGGIFAYGSGAPFLGSMGGQPLNAPIVGMAVMPGGDGYYLVASDGGVFSFGSAQFYGSTGSIKLNKPIVGMAVTPDGGGYWLVASDGGIFSYGDAQFYGSTGAITLNKPIVGMASTPDGKGYNLVASDGGIFDFGDATFSGSLGGTVLNQPIVGMAAPASGGYYLVASDGGIFAFPTVNGPPFEGSTGAITLNKPIVGMTTGPGGYYLSGSDGGVFAFPETSNGPPFLGSTGSITLNAPIVGISS
jgi:hypothetical protein